MFEKILSKIARALISYKIPYMIIGGQAVLRYGEPRLTKDIDVTLGLGVEGFQTVQTVTTSLALRILVEDAEAFVRKTMVLPALDEDSGIRVDFIFSFSEYERQAIDRAVSTRVGEAEVKFASLEDVVIHKVVAGRPRDIEDVKSIILKNAHFDRRYIEKWLAEFDESLAETYSGVFKTILDDLKG